MATEEPMAPDYLISQRTHTCLTVVRGTGVDDAVISLAKRNGGLKQQWFANNGQWLWGGDQTLCLSKDNETGKLCLVPCESASESLILDQESRLILGPEALTVQIQNTTIKVVFKKMNSNLNQKWWTFSQLQTDLRDDALVGEHSLDPSVLDMCKKEMDKDSSDRRTRGNLEPHKRIVCQGDFIEVSCEGEVVIDEAKVMYPEYLINQSTLTCLTVLDDNGPNDADIGLASFDGGQSQQWFINGKQWHWGGNQAYCLFADQKKGEVKLRHATNRITQWNFTDKGYMKAKHKVLQESGDEITRVTLEPKNDEESQRWWKLSDIKAILQVTPTSDTDFPEALLEMVRDMPYPNSADEGQCPEMNSDDVPQHDEQCPASKEPDYLISQSTRTCLTVLDGSNPDEATVGLAPYAGNISQQWFVSDNAWHSVENDLYCLAPDVEGNSLRLVSTNDVHSIWTLDKEGLFTNGPHVLEVPLDEDVMSVVLRPKHGGRSQRWWQLSRLKHYVGLRLYPLPASNDKAYLQELERGIVNSLSPLSESLPHRRDVAHYPGTVPTITQRIEMSCTLRVGTVQQPENIRMRAPKDWQATNMHVVAGDVFTISLPSTLTESQAEQITVRVGAQSDILKPSLPKVKNKHFMRMPIISEDFHINPGVNYLRSQYGGNLIFTYDGIECFEITAEVQNVVETPYYILGETSSDDWDRMKELDTPFSVLESNKVVIIAPTSAAKENSSPDELLRRYDDIMGKIEDLAGFSDDDPPPQGKLWIVDDIQISAGSAHAGFPVMVQHQFNDLASLDTPYSWVIWHEVGHNYQQGKFWSHAYGVESTVNLFSLYVEEKLQNGNRLRRQNKYMPTANAVNNGLTLEKANVWQKLIFLMEIKHAFPDHGWEMFRHLNRVTRSLPQEEAEMIKSQRQKQYDHAYKTLSRFVGSDLILHYQRWSVPISQEAMEEIEALGLRKSPGDLSTYCPCNEDASSSS